MKVTKLIREYITEQVSKAYDAKNNPYFEQAELDRQKLKAFEEELRNQQRKSIETFLSENELFGRYDSSKITTISTQIPSVSYYLTQAIIDERTWKEENIRAKRTKISEIILALELGANRQELNDMIENLLKDGSSDEA